MSSPDPESDTRRDFIKQAAVAGASAAGPTLGVALVLTAGASATAAEDSIESVTVSVTVNGARVSLSVDPRVTLLDALRERLDLAGTKKGCDHGQCGACTVLVDGRRVLSCLTLVASCDGSDVTTIEGLAAGDVLHPLQAAFIRHDGFQCGYCTPGQICSALALLHEATTGDVSHVTPDVRAGAMPLPLSDEEIKERMSGNLCRCGAYPNIVAAIREVHASTSSDDWKRVGSEGRTPFTAAGHG